jgi:hypothetical protein
VLGIALLAASATVAAAAPPAPDVRLFLEAASTDERLARAALDQIGRSWSDDHAALIVDLLRFTRAPHRPAADEDSDLALDDESRPPVRRVERSTQSVRPDPANTLTIDRRPAGFSNVRSTSRQRS